MMRWNEANVEAVLKKESWPYEKRSIQHGIQFVLNVEGDIKVNLYNTGTVLVQGKNNDVKRKAEQLFAQQAHSHQTPDSANLSSDLEIPTRVFIVYGHDVQAREQLELLLRRLKLEPIVLQNVPGGGDTIIEKLEKLTRADFACVLVTPDDEGRKQSSDSSQDEELRPRARQNVVLELGMVLARLGRTRVAILVKERNGELERPSDIDGLLYIPFRDHVNDAKNLLASNLQNAGFSIQIEDLLS